MKKTLIILGTFILMASCTVQKPLYSWEKYEKASYAYLKNSDDESTQNLIENYEKIIDQQSGTRNVPPPGICADYAFVLLEMGKTDKGKELLQREIELYPESRIFIERILKMLDR